MRMLITGGTGFIGRSLCRSLLQEGHDLTVLSRNPATVSERCGGGVAALGRLGDLSPSDAFEAIVNLAGEPIFGPRWTAVRKKVLWDSRVTLTERLVELIAGAKHKPEVLISGSAVGFYGDQGDRVLDEAAGPADDFGHQLCSGWEKAAQAASDLGVRVVILRTGLVVGRSGGFLQRMLLPFRLGLGGAIGGGRQWMSWIHLDDHIAATKHLLNSPALSGAFNLTAPNPVTNRQFTDCLAALLKRPAVLPLPAWMLKLVLGEMASLVLGGQRVLPRRLEDSGFVFGYPTLEEALRQALQRG